MKPKLDDCIYGYIALAWMEFWKLEIQYPEGRVTHLVLHRPTCLLQEWPRMEALQDFQPSIRGTLQSPVTANTRHRACQPSVALRRTHQ